MTVSKTVPFEACKYYVNKIGQNANKKTNFFESLNSIVKFDFYASTVIT